ncbi:DUF5519 family protein [Actinocorallia sp. API 0066]|uniref:luciferase family protein n=1 Tax=Actinocorallia sp. API 0066 TaxID=2896846 RepID=UPI001E2ACD2C|nr:luciferase family protein [Actinocorallia sp. API 0066]MCD0450304.1 DUF5519 family protein [Actinocorallia sp. API 0066]
MDDAPAESPLSLRVISLTRSWPRLRVERAECGVGYALAVAGGQVAHLHDDDAELLLGEASVDRIRPALELSGRIVPEGPAIRVRLESENDVRLLLSLLSVAIKTGGAREGNGPWCRVARRRAAVG